MADSIQIGIVPDPLREVCSAAKKLAEALGTGQLVDFAATFSAPQTDGFTNCHEIASALLADLSSTGLADGWLFVSARVNSQHRARTAHSWLEYDGWAVDASQQRVIVMNAEEYRRLYTASDVVERTVDDWVACVQRHEVPHVVDD